MSREVHLKLLCRHIRVWHDRDGGYVAKCTVGVMGESGCPTRCLVYDRDEGLLGALAIVGALVGSLIGILLGRFETIVGLGFLASIVGGVVGYFLDRYRVRKKARDIQLRGLRIVVW